MVFADTEHAVDAAPTVTHVALNTAADRREQSVSDAGEALNLLVTDAGTAVVLYRRTTDAQIVVEETRLDRPTSRVVLTSDDPVALLGIVPR